MLPPAVSTERALGFRNGKETNVALFEEWDSLAAEAYSAEMDGGTHDRNIVRRAIAQMNGKSLQLSKCIGSIQIGLPDVWLFIAELHPEMPVRRHKRVAQSDQSRKAKKSRRLSYLKSSHTQN